MADAHIEDRLPDYVLGLLTSAEQADIQRHLHTCVACREAAQALAEATHVAAVGLGAPANVRTKLDEALRGGRRFEHLVDQVAGLFDLSADSVRALLEQVDDEGAWQEGPGTGCRLIPVLAGPKCEGKIVALLKLDPECTFPEHAHGDEERVLVLEGGYRDSTGIEKWRGELDVRPKGSAHSFVAFEGLPCICASVSAFPDDA